jgi:hypothetical protein
MNFNKTEDTAPAELRFWVVRDYKDATPTALEMGADCSIL